MTEIHDRVTQLEHDMVEVRYLATKADHEASGNTATLRGQVGLLNALKETQREHGETLAKHTKMLADHGKRLVNVERMVDAGFAQADKNFAQADKNFAQIDENFAKVEDQFKQVRTGIAEITGLLTDKIDKIEET